MRHIVTTAIDAPRGLATPSSANRPPLALDGVSQPLPVRNGRKELHDGIDLTGRDGVMRSLLSNATNL
jgi:hypothetical protein